MGADALMSHPGLERRIAALRRRRIHSPDNRDVRAVVRLRAHDTCEYCLLPTTGMFHVEHIIPRSLWDGYVHGRLPGVPSQPGRGGPDHIDNYAWSCPYCNGRKGERVSLDIGQRAVRFFDPRYDVWPDHFTFLAGSKYLFLDGLSPEGRATAQGLGFNEGGTDGPLGTRHVRILDSDYPPSWARSAYDI
jgi:5-methylcytosine-specific restriction endonuclease McrA